MMKNTELSLGGTIQKRHVFFSNVYAACALLRGGIRQRKRDDFAVGAFQDRVDRLNKHVDEHDIEEDEC